MFDYQPDDAGGLINLSKILRGICGSVDKVLFTLMNYMYKLFFTVTSTDLFNNDTMLKFYGRIQLIIGVFMIYELTVSTLKSIVNPSDFTDDSKGLSSIITRILFSLFMLVLITPISIDNPQNNYERQINNNGILFGTLYSLQNSLIENNTLGQLVLGDSSSIQSSDENSDSNSLEGSFDTASFTTAIVKTFYKINLKESSERTHEEDKADYEIQSNRMCEDVNYDDDYINNNSDFNKIIDKINDNCGSVDKKYQYAYTSILPAIAAIIISIILLSYTIDVGVRAVKLAVLRLIAPIPIIKYMSTDEEKNKAFSSWTKSLTSTYLDLFLRLAIMYFAFYLIEGITTGGAIQINTDDNIIGSLATIAIIIAILTFASQAPKFIGDAIGIEMDDFKMFGGIGSAMGIGALAGGAIGSTIAGARASWAATEKNGSHTGNSQSKILKGLNLGKNVASAIGSGIAGGIGGTMAGASAFSEAKDNRADAVLKATAERNRATIAAGRAGSTIPGRLGSTFRTLFTGESASSKGTTDLERLKGKKDILEAIDSRVKDKAATASWTRGSTSFNGTTYSGINYQDFQASYTQAKTAGNSSFQYEAHNDKTGMDETVSITIKDAELGMHNLQTSNEDYYYQNYGDNGGDAELDSLVGSAHDSGINPTSRSDYKHSIEEIGIQIRNQEAKNKRTEANDRFSGNK